MSEHIAVVTGASRGFGRAIAAALVAGGARVVGVARDRAALAEVADQLGDGFTPVVGDVTDPVLAGALIDRHRPRTLVLNAGAAPLSRPIHRHTWQTFSRAWEVDAQHVFHWTREALLRPLDPGSAVVAMSSGAALFGSPISGGYAGAKATVRFIAAYARDESERAGLGIRFTSVLPALTPLTDLGSAAVAGYAARAGVTPEQSIAGMGDLLTPEQVGAAVRTLATDSGHDEAAYRLTAAGLEALK